MVTSLEITNSFLIQLKSKIDDTNVTPDVLSNLLNQYQTITNMIRDGYQFSAVELADLPATLRAELAVMVESEFLTINNSLDLKLDSGNPSISSDLDLLFLNGFYRVNSDAPNIPTPSYYSLIVFGNQSNTVSQIASNFQSGVTYVRSFNVFWTAWSQIN